MIFKRPYLSFHSAGASFAVVAVLLAFSHPAPAQTVILHLKNGDRLSGTVLTQEVSRILLKTALGPVAVPADLVARQETLPTAPTAKPAVPPSAPKAPPAPSPQDARERLKVLTRQYEAGTLSASEYHLQRAGLIRELEAGRNPVPQPPPPAAASVRPSPGKAAKPAVAPPRSQWAGEAQIGTDLAFSTKDRRLFTGRLKASYSRQRFQNTMEYLFTYGKTDGEISANRMNGSMKSDWRVSPKFYVYNLGGAGYDEIRKIDLHYEAGPGLGYPLLQGKDLALSSELGVNYQAEERFLSEKDRRFYFRLAEIATFKLNSKLSLDEKAEWFPQVERPDHYRVRVEANARYLLAENLSLVFSVLDQFDTDPAPQVDRNDLQIRSSLGMKF
jgi:Protein of unknown function, DUF481